MKKALLLISAGAAALFLWTAAAFALPAQKLLYPGDWIYEGLASLALEQRLVFLSGSSMTLGEAAGMFGKIRGDELSPGGRVLYERIGDYLDKPSLVSYKSGLLAFDALPAFQPEFYGKTNADLEWIYDRNKRQPFLSLPLTFSLSSYISLGTDVYFGENRMLSRAPDNYSNFVFDKMIDGVQSIDTNMPKRAYISAGFPFKNGVGVNFRLGMGDNSFGRTKTGSIILSGNMRDPSYAELSVYAPFVKYSAGVTELEVTKYLYTHHFQLAVLNRFSFALVEGVMVNAPLELRFINPAMIFHGFSAWESYREYNKDIGEPSLPEANSRIGSLLGLVFDVRPWRYGRFYGLFAMNQFEIPSERADPKNTVPDGLAFQLGYESHIPAFQGYWKFGLEGVYTYPYMYILTDKRWSFYRQSYEVSNPPIREWVGTPFGPDSIAGIFWTSYEDPARWSLSLSFLFLAQGENSSTGIFDKPGTSYYAASHEEAALLSPTGIPSYTYRLSFEGTWSPRNWMDLAVRPAYKIVMNHGNRDGNLQHGFECVLSARFVLLLPGKEF
jgi:hypothetical protein